MWSNLIKNTSPETSRLYNLTRSIFTEGDEASEHSHNVGDDNIDNLTNDANCSFVSQDEANEKDNGECDDIDLQHEVNEGIVTTEEHSDNLIDMGGDNTTTDYDYSWSDAVETIETDNQDTVLVANLTSSNGSDHVDVNDDQIDEEAIKKDNDADDVDEIFSDQEEEEQGYYTTDEDESDENSQNDEEEGEEFMKTKKTSPPHLSIVSSLVGTRFNYMGRVAQTILNQVVVTSPTVPVTIESSLVAESKELDVTELDEDDVDNEPTPDDTIDDIFSKTDNNERNEIHSQEQENVPTGDVDIHSNCENSPDSEKSSSLYNESYKTMQESVEMDQKVIGVENNELNEVSNIQYLSQPAETLPIDDLQEPCKENELPNQTNNIETESKVDGDDGWDQDLDVFIDQGLDQNLEPEPEVIVHGESSCAVPVLSLERTVDQIPTDLQMHAPTNGSRESCKDVLEDPSLIVLAEVEDLTRDADTTNSEHEDGYDDENEFNFGPVVDQIPTLNSTSLSMKDACDSVRAVSPLRESHLPSVAYSVMTEDDNDEDENRSTPVSMQGGGDKSDPYYDFVNALTPVVDHTPADAYDIPMELPMLLTRGLSMAVCQSEGDTLDNTIAEADDLNVDDDAIDQDNLTFTFGPMVDQTPAAPLSSTFSPSLSGANSLAVNVATLEEDFYEDAAMDETYYGDSTIGCGETSVAGGGSTLGISTVNDGWGEEELVYTADDGDDDTTINDSNIDFKKPEKRTTFSLDLNTVRRHVVDHTPSEFFQASYRTVDDENTYENVNESDFGLVVDCTPISTSAFQPTSIASVTNSLAVLMPVVKEDSLASDDPYEYTSHGDSSVGHGAEMANEKVSFTNQAVNLEKLDDVDVSPSDVAVVDHTPSDMDTQVTSNKDPSIFVLPSEANTRATGDADSTGENAVYGPVVDQTPTTQVLPNFYQRSDSVVVQVQDLDTVDETTVVGGSRVDEGDDDVSCDDQDIPGELPTDVGKLVDYVPPRFETHLGDASTVVAAEPSEVLSEVDDLAPEEENFGPVVDQIPPNQLTPEILEVPSGAGSTAVFAPLSVAADDLDEDPGTESQGDQHDDWQNNIPNVATGDGPNPQSGNDEPVVPIQEENEQLVDFLPPVHTNVSNEVDDDTREGISEMTVGGAQSLLQTGDLVDEDFGPVVDLTPIGQLHQPRLRSQASNSTQATVHEDRIDEGTNSSNQGNDDRLRSKVVVNPLPRLVSNKPIDSTATMERSQISEEEEEDDASTKFGPVVDQLPTSRASLAPSRGGSTVDALANVSEANSDDDDGDDEGVGWDEDIDFDASIGGVSDGTGQPTLGSALRQSIIMVEQDRNTSVRFDTSVYEHSDTGFGSTSTLDRTQFYHESESGYSVLKEGTSNLARDQWGKSCDGLEEGGDHFYQPYQITDKSFAEADTPPSTPYRRLDSKSVTINYSTNDLRLPVMGNLGSKGKLSVLKKLTGNNAEQSTKTIAKAENESSALSSFESSNALCSSRESELLEEISLLKLAKESFLAQYNKSQNECCDLKRETVLLKNELSECRKSVNVLENQVADSVMKNNSLDVLVKELKDSSEAYKVLSASITNELQSKVSALEVELDAKTLDYEKIVSDYTKLTEAKKLNDQISKTEQETSLNEESKSGETFVTRNADDKSRKILQLEEKIYGLQDLISFRQAEHDADAQKQQSLLEAERVKVHALDSTIKQLKTENTALSLDLATQRSLGGNSDRLAKEILAVVQERDALQGKLRESQSAVCLLEDEMRQAQQESYRIIQERDALQQKLYEIDETTSKVADDVSNLRKVEEDSLKIVKECDFLRAQLHERQRIVDTLVHDLNALKEVQREFESILQERDAAKENLLECESIAFALVDQLTVLLRGRHLSDTIVQEHGALQTLLRQSQSAIDALGEEINTLRVAREATEEMIQERDSLQVQLEENQKRIVALEKEMDDTQKVQLQMRGLLTEERDALQLQLHERQTFSSDLEDEVLALQKTQVEYKILCEKHASIQSQFCECQGRIATLESEINILHQGLSESEKLSGEHESLKERLCESQSKARAFKDEANDLRIAQENFEKRILELQCMVERSTKEIEIEAMKKDQEIEKVHDEWERERLLLSAEIQLASEKGMRSSTEAFADLQAQFLEIKAERDNQKAEIEDLLIEFGLSSQRLNENNEINIDLKARLEKAQNDLADANEEKGVFEKSCILYESEIAELKHDINERQKLLDLAALKEEETMLALEQSQELVKHARDIEKVLESTKVLVTVAEQESLENSEEVKDYMNRVSLLEHDLERKDSAISQLERSLSESQHEDAQFKEEHANLQQKYIHVQQQLSDLTKRIEHIQSVSDLKDSNIEVHKETELALQIEVKELNEFIEHLQAKVLNLQDEVVTVAEKYRREQDEVTASFRVLVDSLNASLKQSSDRIQAKQSQIDLLSKEISLVRDEKIEEYLRTIRLDNTGVNSMSDMKVNGKNLVRTSEERTEAMNRILSRHKGNTEMLEKFKDSI